MAQERLGHYALVRKLGEGGMGTVYEAIYEPLGRRVAIKVLSEEYCKQKETVHRFFQEARAANIVQHPGVVGVFEVDQTPEGVAYLVMEYLEGESLGTRLHRLGRLPEGLHVIRQIAAALSAAHERGVVHRDLKPGNVMLVKDPEAATGERAKVLDFGIAKLVAEHHLGGKNAFLTRSGVLMGTPVYMSPEQCRDSALVTERTDVYSLGIIWYQMLTGKPPFDATSVGEVIAMHLYSTPRPLTEVCPDVDPDVARVVHKLLAKEPTDRPPMKEVVAMLEQLGAKATAGLSAVAAPSVVPALVPALSPALAQAPTSIGPRTPPSIVAAQMASQAPSLPPPNPSGRAFVSILALVCVAVVGLVGLFSYRRHLAGAPPLQQPTVIKPPASITLRLKTVPHGAQILRESDGVLLGMTPWEGQRQPEEGHLPLLVRLAGYQDRRVLFDLRTGELVGNEPQPLALLALAQPPQEKVEPPEQKALRHHDKNQKKVSAPPKEDKAKVDHERDDDEELQIRPLR